MIDGLEERTARADEQAEEFEAQLDQAMRMADEARDDEYSYFDRWLDRVIS